MGRNLLRRRKAATVLMARRSAACRSCGGPLRWRTATAGKPLVLVDYGLSVKISGVPVAACASCSTSHALIGRAETFRDGIVEQILQRPGALTADEIVFLRKHLALTGGRLAALVGVSREHVSHIEQGHTPSLGTAADRLARLMVAAKCDPSLKLLKRVLAGLGEEIGTRAKRKQGKIPGYSFAPRRRG